MKKSKVIPLPTARFQQDTPPEPLQLLSHPDVQVTQESEGCYRIRAGAAELTFDANCGPTGAWYLHLPGHEEAVLPVSTEQYDPENQPYYINIDRDRKGRVIGIEIV